MEKSDQGGNIVLQVLLVESSARDAERLLDALRGGGYEVSARRVERFDQIANSLKECRFDVILLGCSVPGLPAAEAIAMLHAQAPAVPVILTLEGNRNDFPTELLESGACDFVFKRNPIRLLMVVERECARGVLNRDTPASAQLRELSDPLNKVDEGEARFFQLVSNVPECYWLTDAESQRVTYVSKGYEHIWGVTLEALYADAGDLLNNVHPEDLERVAEALAQHAQGGLDIKFRVQRPNDKLRWLHARNFPIRDEAGSVISVGGVASDITSLVVQRKVPYFAHFDALTALPNQLMFYDQARHLIALARRRNLSVGVMVIDIDRFREVNQTLGHTSGDELLRQVAGRLSGSLRESDTLGRLGGDVFAVLLPDMSDVHQAGIVAQRIIDTLMMPVRVEGQDVFATASIGVAFFPLDGQDVHELVSNCEIAVRHAKSLGRNGYQIYAPEMHDSIRDRLLLETDLRNAMLRGEFVLYYQPKASCANGRVTGAEALIRWKHPVRGIVPPDQFIPLLEETGLIVQVGRWVLGRQAIEWQRSGLDIPSVSVNLSARQLQSESLIDDIAAALVKTGLPAACLDLEITESMLMHNAEAAIRTLIALKETGVTISLDDFGTGYSSLAYLRRFPLDAVKVDRSFVQDIAADSDDASITRAVITMAHHLKLKVVAEGVETSEQLALLISHQCDIIQGYFFARPLPAPDLAEFLNDEKRLPAHLLNSGTRKPMALFVGVEGDAEAIAMLIRDGHRVCRTDNLEGAMQWFTGNLVDVLVCGASHQDFDAIAVIEATAHAQPQCERILLADSRQWASREVAELSSNGRITRAIQLPIEPVALRQVVEEALNRRHISEEFSRLSHEVEIAERELVRVEEERRRLAAENETLQEQEALGYQVLQEVMAELPWPVLGIDEEDMLALINEAAYAAFSDRGLFPGAPMFDLLPELSGLQDGEEIELAGRHFMARWRNLRLGGVGRGRLLLLEDRKS